LRYLPSPTTPLSNYLVVYVAVWLLAIISATPHELMKCIFSKIATEITPEKIIPGKLYQKKLYRKKLHRQKLSIQ
jgi:hypothetical protein